MLYACIDALTEVRNETGEDIPLVIGVSEGEEEAMGRENMRLLIDEIQKNNLPVFLNADHSYSVERCKKSIDAGFDMVIYDNVKAPFEENAAGAKEVVEYAREKGTCLVEAELGYIGSGSSIKDEIPEGVGPESMTNPDEAKEYVLQTGVDMLAPSVGNLHGMVKSGNPVLDPERVREVRESAGVPLVLHGVSGSTDEDFLSVIDAGISMIHISTELRKAYHEGLKEGIESIDSVAPYKYMKIARENVYKKAKERIKLFWRV